jgi:hypothetical protein
MSEQQGVTEAKLLQNIEDVVEKITKLPGNEELNNIANELVDLAKDIRIVIRKSFEEKESFDGFVLVFRSYHGADVLAPNSRVEVSFIEARCLQEKSVYACLQEKFANKAGILNALLVELEQALDRYFSTLSGLLSSQEEDDDP